MFRDTAHNDNQRWNAVQRLISTYEGALLRYVSRLTGNSSSAEDVVQNTFIKFIRKWNQGMDDEHGVSSWLYRVAHNEAVDHLRAEARIRKLHTEHGEECMAQMRDTRPESISERAENAAQALQQLTDRERQLVVLKIYEEKSYKEIAEITGLTTSNVGFILHTAMKKLAKIMTIDGEAK